MSEHHENTLINPTCIVKLGFTGVYIASLISAQKHELWVFVRTASTVGTR